MYSRKSMPQAFEQYFCKCWDMTTGWGPTMPRLWSAISTPCLEFWNSFKCLGFSKASVHFELFLILTIKLCLFSAHSAWKMKKSLPWKCIWMEILLHRVSVPRALSFGKGLVQKKWNVACSHWSPNQAAKAKSAKSSRDHWEPDLVGLLCAGSASSSPCLTMMDEFTKVKVALSRVNHLPEAWLCMSATTEAQNANTYIKLYKYIQYVHHQSASCARSASILQQFRAIYVIRIPSIFQKLLLSRQAEWASAVSPMRASCACQVNILPCEQRSHAYVDKYFQLYTKPETQKKKSYLYVSADIFGGNVASDPLAAESSDEIGLLGHTSKSNVTIWLYIYQNIQRLQNRFQKLVCFPWHLNSIWFFLWSIFSIWHAPGSLAAKTKES